MAGRWMSKATIDKGSEMNSTQNSTPEPLLLTYRDICAMLHIGKSAFFRLRQEGRFPVRPIRLHGAVRYIKSDVVNWIQNGCKPDWKSKP